MRSHNVSLIIFVSFSFKNNVPNSASAANAATHFSIWHMVKIAPLRWMGCLSCGVHQMKKCLADRLSESIADNYGEYEWTFRIMLDT